MVLLSKYHIANVLLSMFYISLYAIRTVSIIVPLNLA